MGVMTDLAGPPGTTLSRAELTERLPAHRRELTGYCYRMLGSVHDAEDAVQETMVRAWRGVGSFEGRSSLRTWLFRIATNVCVDALKGRTARALPMDLNAEDSPPVESSLGTPEPASSWVGPISDGAVLPASSDPAEVAVARESVRLAFVAALQHLPPRQRAVLVLRDVLRWHADEVAQLLDSTVASVNSALQRARATVAARRLDAPGPVDPPDEALDALLERYVAAFERYDIDALVELLREDATQSMPPFRLGCPGRRTSRPGCSVSVRGAATRSSCGCRRTGAPRWRSTAPTPTAATCPGASTCSTSPAARSSGSPRSSTRRCFHTSGWRCAGRSRSSGSACADRDSAAIVPRARLTW